MGLLSLNSQKKWLNQGYDLDLLKAIQPQGNLNFKPDRYYYGGDGYYTILHVYEYPTDALPNFWLLDLMQINGTRAFLSVYREDNSKIKRKINQAIPEKGSRITGNSKLTENQKEINEIQTLNQLYQLIENKNISMLGMYIRIFVTDSTLEGLFKKVEEIKERHSKYKMTILSGELDFEQNAIFTMPSEQIDLPNKRRGVLLPAFSLAGGYFFNHTKLEDPQGSYYGFTSTNGAVNFNFLTRDERRNRSFMIISGNPKMGQTHFALKMNDDLYSKGHYIRNFDASGTFRHQTKQQHGLILNLAGSENRINPFQIFPTATNEDGTQVDEIRSFELHVEKLKNMVKMLNDAITADDLQTFDNLLTNFYIAKKIWYRNPKMHLNELRATKIAKEECPILSDFVNYLYDAERQLSMKRTINPLLLTSVSRIKQTFETLLQSHSGIFEGTTEFQDISNEKVVTFDFSSLKDQPSLFNAQVFSVLSLLSADIANNGKKWKYQLKQNSRLKEEDCPHYIVNIGDAQNLINPRYQRSVDLLANIMSNMGENFAGVILSVQSLQGILINSSVDETHPYVVAVRRIFALMQYRVFAQTSETDVPLLGNALGGSMNRSELDALPRLTKGQLFMNIAGVGNIVFKQQFMNDEIKRYGVM